MKKVINTNEKVQASVEVKEDNVLTKFNEELKKFETTSAKIRYLDSKNVSRGNISKILNIRYQHVRNVLITPVTNMKEKVSN